MDNIESIIKSLLQDDASALNILVNISNSNEITDKIKEGIATLEPHEIATINLRLERILRSLYFNEDNIDLSSLNEEEKFTLKENCIYYIGRITEKPNIDLIKQIYHLEDNKHLQLNLVFSSLLSGDEELEKDFINKLTPGSDYDILLRSWTLAFFKNAENPYNYIDEGLDWEAAKEPRLKRLAINDESNLKIKKVKAFRWFDLVVLWLFLNNRGFNTMTDDEYKIVEEAKIDFPSYSKEKIEEMKSLKEKILQK